MSKSNSFANDVQALIFNNTAIANIGDTSGLQPSATEGSLYISLTTTVPTSATPGTEATYTGYARQAVARNSGGFTVAGVNVSNAAVVQFPEATAGSETIQGFEIWTAVTGGDRLEWGQVDTPLAVSVGIDPKFNIGDFDSNED